MINKMVFPGKGPREAAILLKIEGYYQVSRTHRLLARLPKGKTILEAITEHPDRSPDIVTQALNAWPLTKALDYYLRCWADQIEVDEDVFREFRRIGGSSVV